MKSGHEAYSCTACQASISGSEPADSFLFFYFLFYFSNFLLFIFSETHTHTHTHFFSDDNNAHYLTIIHVLVVDQTRYCEHHHHYM